jgi:transcriptional regulator with XRE-family HTH domain
MPDGADDMRNECIGRRIREARLMASMSQEALGRRIGITFQQIQKYERGINRISVVRLADIADCLGCSLLFFMEVLESTHSASLLESFLRPEDLRRNRAMLDTIRHLQSIPDRNVRQQVRLLVKAIAAASDGDTEAS